MSNRKFPPLPVSTKPIHRPGTITKEWTDPDGDRYYETSDGKVWCADLYDLNFKVTRLAIIAKFRPDGTYEKSPLNLKPNR